jgi:hypothetical protein
MITLAAQRSGLGPSTGRGDTVSASDFGTVGGIGKSRGASCDTVNRGQDNDALGAHDLSTSTIGGGGPALCIPGVVAAASVYLARARAIAAEACHEI